MRLAWEPVVVLLLVIISGSVFARTLWIKIRAVLAGPSDRPRLDHLGARLRRTAAEVLLQTRVVRNRPVVGLLHAVVFLGFLLFAPETIEHFLKPFGVSLLEPLLGGLLPYYRALMLVVATAVAVAIAGLAFRRFVMVKTSPDPKSGTSALVAAFIFLLMITYLNGRLQSPIAAQANWWAHALIILAFPHLIIKSKHFHILLAPISVLLRNDRIGDYVALDLEALAEADVEEVTLGLETVKSLPRKMRLDFLTCVECRRCADNCPSAIAGNQTNPREMILGGRRALFASQPEDPVIGTVVSEEALGMCATCGACEDVCPVGVEHLQVVVGAKRAQALSTGKGVVAGDYFRAIESHGNALKLPKSDRQTTIQELALPKFSGAEGDWLLWLGCVWGYSPEQKPAVKAFRDVLNAAGVRYGVLDEEPCCGHHSRRQGEESQFQDLARRTLETLESSSARKVVTPCPHCLHTMSREHVQFNGRHKLTFIHHSEMLAGLLEKGAIAPRNGAQAKTVAFHDPCYLARYEKITEAPRQALAAVRADIKEMDRSRRRTLCCGGGAAGFVREVKNEKRLDQARRTEIKASGASLLVTACPECRMMLDAALDETRDIAEIIAAAVCEPETVAALEASAGKGGPMLSVSFSEGLAHQVLDFFEHNPQTEFPLLTVAGRVHYRGKLCELKHAADHLVDTGELLLQQHGGGRYYRLGKSQVEEKEGHEGRQGQQRPGHCQLL